jgi:hypothetical protein
MDGKLVSRERWKLVRPVLMDAGWTSFSSRTARRCSNAGIDVFNWRFVTMFVDPNLSSQPINDSPLREIYVSTDIETDGPVAGKHSMLSIGSQPIWPTRAAGDVLRQLGNAARIGPGSQDRRMVGHTAGGMVGLPAKSRSACRRPDTLRCLAQGVWRTASVCRVPGNFRFFLRRLVCHRVRGRQPIRLFGN